MKRLAIETSTNTASVALRIDSQLLQSDRSSIKLHAEQLLPMIADLLQRADLSVAQLDGIAFGCGPGSFTGLRIACSIAKGLAFAHDLPLYPMSSLALIADHVYCRENIDTPILSMLDARMQQLYWQVFNVKGDPLTEPCVSAAIDIDYFASVIAGTGFAQYIIDLPKLAQLPSYTVIPHASTMLTGSLWERTQCVSATDALPMYVRNQVVAVGEKRG